MTKTPVEWFYLLNYICFNTAVLIQFTLPKIFYHKKCVIFTLFYLQCILMKYVK